MTSADSLQHQFNVVVVTAASRGMEKLTHHSALAVACFAVDHFRKRAHLVPSGSIGCSEKGQMRCLSSIAQDAAIEQPFHGYAFVTCCKSDLSYTADNLHRKWEQFEAAHFA